MKKLLRALVASMVMVAMYSASVLAIVFTDPEIEDIHEIGLCNPVGTSIEALGNCGFGEVKLPTPDGVYPNPNPDANGVRNGTVTSFRFNDSSHEIVGTLRYQATVAHEFASEFAGYDADWNYGALNSVCETINETNPLPWPGGQRPGYVSRAEAQGVADWDIPDRLFSCSDNSRNASILGPSLLDPTGANGCGDLAFTNNWGVPAVYQIDDPLQSLNFPYCFDPFPLYDTGDCAQQLCIVAPDNSGRLDSRSCSNYFNPGWIGNAFIGVAEPFQYDWDLDGDLDGSYNATYGCRLPGWGSEGDDLGYLFFNYMACEPDITCFDADPMNNTTCDQGSNGPFGSVTDTHFPDLDDVWIAGTITTIRLPYGVRLGNSVYPGVMLNGSNQFDHSANASMRMWPLAGWATNPGNRLSEEPTAWPAVIYDFEANHWVVESGPNTKCNNIPEQVGECCGWDRGAEDYGAAEVGINGIEFDSQNWNPYGSLNGPDAEPNLDLNFSDSNPETTPNTFAPRCRARFGNFDRIKIFVPDILVAPVTTVNNPSVFQIGESLINQGGLIPASRGEVENCYTTGTRELCTWLPQVINNYCDYDTSICIDIRGAIPAMRHDSVYEFSRYVHFDLEVPNTSFTDFSNEHVKVAVLTPGVPPMLDTAFTSTVVSYPNCEGFNDCFITLLDYDPEQNPGTGTTVADDDDWDWLPGTDPDDPGWLFIPAESVGTISITEPDDGFIRVGAGTTTAITCRFPEAEDYDDPALARDLDSVVNFADWDCNVTYEIWPDTEFYRQDCCYVDEPQLAGFGGTLKAEVTAASNMDLLMVDSQQTRDQISVIITEPSSGTPATITISGIELVVQEDNKIFPGGVGCIDVICRLTFTGGDCRNHEGLANDDLSAGNVDPDLGDIVQRHLPSGSGYFENMVPIACIVPGRTVLLFPYLVRMLDADENVWHDSGISIVNTMPAWAITHFYLYEEAPAGPAGGKWEQIGNIQTDKWSRSLGYELLATNPSVTVLNKADPERLIRGESPEYEEYNEIAPLGLYTNMLFEVKDDPFTSVPLNSIRAMPDGEEGSHCMSIGSEELAMTHSSGIFPYDVLEQLSSDPDCDPTSIGGRVWMYAVVQQCYSHGYQIVFSDYGFGSTLALVDQETTLTPINAAGSTLVRDPVNGTVAAAAYIPVHTAPARFYRPGWDFEVRSYSYWNGNDE